jgi:hypothetical protein
MINAYKNRSIDLSKPVLFYRCLTRKGRVFSIKQQNKVVGHCEEIILKDCEFIVNLKVSISIKETKKRFVHAYIKGYVVDKAPDNIYIKVGYDPYFDYTFKTMNGSIHNSDYVLLTKTGLYTNYK